MVSRGKRRRVKLAGNCDACGLKPEDAAKALKELRTIGGLLVRSSVGLLNGEAADQFVWLGQQIQAHADQGMAALDGHAGAVMPRRRSRP